MIDVLLDTLIDGLRLVPFLFLTYLVMEYIEHRTSDKTKQMIHKSGRFGPVIGGLLGAFPQCGFGAAASNLYAGRIITLGTLISIYLSTSDEMLPILISEAVDIRIILKIIGAKVVIGMIAGLVIDLVVVRKQKHKEEEWKIHDMCEHEHCHCEKSIFKSAVRHSLQVLFFILLVSLILNVVIYFVGEDSLSNLFFAQPIIGEIVAGLVGLIPNCASSVVITQLYLEGVIGIGAMMSGLLVGAGVGLLVLFRVNESLKENLKIVGLLYVIGVAAGILIEWIL